MTGLGKLAKGEILDELSGPSFGPEAMDPKGEGVIGIEARATQAERVSETAGGGGKAKKKKGRK